MALAGALDTPEGSVGGCMCEWREVGELSYVCAQYRPNASVSEVSER